MGRPLLFLVGGMFIVVGIVQSGTNNRHSLLHDRVIDYHSELHAENAVNSVMDYALEEIINDQDWTDGYHSPDYMDAEVTVEVFNHNHSDIPPNDIDTWDQFTLLVHGTAVYGDKIARSEIHLRKNSFSQYSYFTDYEPSNIYFIWSDEVWGPVHTNGRFNIAGDPTFHGRVTSPEMWRGHGGYTNDPQFLSGSDFNAPERSPPSQLDLEILRDAASSGGVEFDEEVKIEFLEGEKIRVMEVDSGMEYELSLEGSNGVISSTEKISLRGSVDGSYTVHSTNDIFINGDVVYNDNPHDNPDSEDLLGIVSEQNVRIERNAHQYDGNSDIHVHASIMALGNSFGAEDYNTGSPRGELHLLGGIIQERRAAVGTFSGSGISSGFSKQYRYDDRLQYLIPPSFPRESVFSVEHWITNVYPHQEDGDDSEEEPAI